MSQIPQSRAQFEYHLNLLERKLSSGSLQLSSQMELLFGGLKKVRYSPNQRFNLLTVDELVRNMANTLANADQMMHSPSNSDQIKPENDNEIDNSNEPK